MSSSILSIRVLCKTFGALKALNNVTFNVEENEILGIIGPNGAGKTTLFNVIVGIYKSDGGDITFRGRSIKHLLPHDICRMGITKTSQIVHPFLALTVKENIMVALMFGQGLNKKESKKKADEIMEFLGISDVKDMHSAAISLPKRRKLELARALGTGAEVILMDENLAGLNPMELEEGMDIVRELKRRGKTLVIVEHIMKAIMGVCGRTIVLNYGEKIAEGTPYEVCSDEKVITAYLGERICSQ
ncbi:MAG: ABC transporter ATP-binding protein [Syntrophobacterales bacterium]|jgi:branched-chain amino acid transport system ATP-binding protein|nr:ABC transporter ATP-binding protein [Syntrophobacterales bacterium]